MVANREWKLASDDFWPSSVVVVVVAGRLLSWRSSTQSTGATDHAPDGTGLRNLTPGGRKSSTKGHPRPLAGLGPLCFGEWHRFRSCCCCCCWANCSRRRRPADDAKDEASDARKEQCTNELPNDQRESSHINNNLQRKQQQQQLYQQHRRKQPMNV